MVRVVAAVAAAACAALALLPAQAAQAQPGLQDTGFGAGGQARTPFGRDARAAAVALGPGGSISVAGDVRGAGGESTLVARFTAAGAIDTTFNGAGLRLDRFGAGGSTTQGGRAITVQPDGATIVAGVAGDQVMLARYLPGGGLDGLFGAGGIVLRGLSGGAGMPANTGLSAIALSPTGQVYVAGSVGVPAADVYEDEPSEQIVVGRLSDRGVPIPRSAAAASPSCSSARAAGARPRPRAPTRSCCCPTAAS